MTTARTRSWTGGAAMKGGTSPGKSWVMISGNGSQEIVQPEETWFDLNGAASYKALNQILGITNCTLVTQGAWHPQGPWFSLDTSTQAKYKIDLATFFGSTDTLGRWMRWKVVGSGEWKICFRMEAIAADGPSGDTKNVPGSKSGNAGATMPGTGTRVPSRTVSRADQRQVLEHLGLGTRRTQG